jgi:LuxR family maltose regulon positive regulatory protein
VLESKLRIPVPPKGAVPRKTLLNRLRAERSVRLAAVVAGAGYGKTTLLAQWAARDERPFAWVSIDERDNDPLVLLRHLAAAFDRLKPLDAAALDKLAEPGASVWPAAVPRLAVAVSVAGPFVAVLDDAHLLRAGDSADIVAALAEHVPNGSMLVLAGRRAPALPIARLRSRGQLLELRTSDLALDRREAQLLVRESGAELDDASVEGLIASAEGWAAGLRLAALETGGTARFLAEYFEAECLAQLPAKRRTFLYRTSVLDRMSGPLCDAVLEAKGSALALDQLDRLNAFLVPLDREPGWYRYHPLFRDLLRRELERREPELVPELDLRAAAWLEDHGDSEAALGHAWPDARRAGRILTSIALAAYRDGRRGTVERWLQRFAACAPLEAHPDVAVVGAWIHALDGRAAEAEHWFGAAAGPQRALLGAARCADGSERMAADAKDAVEGLAGDSVWLPSALLLQGAAAVLRGETELAEAAFAGAGEAAERTGAEDVRLVATAERSLLAADAGDHIAAERLALEARDLLAASSLDGYATSAIVRAAAARAFLRHGRWADARAELGAAERVTGLTHALPWYAVRTRLVLSGAYVTLRDRRAAVAHLAEIERILALRPGLGVLVEHVDDLRLAIAELPAERAAEASGLTRAELRLLPLLATHLSFREIGDRLYVSRNTVKTQAISAYRKLGVSSRSAAVDRASELGLVDERAVPAAAGRD